MSQYQERHYKKTQYIVSMASKEDKQLIHLPNCPYVRNINKENRMVVEIKSSELHKYHQCAFCSQIKLIADNAYKNIGSDLNEGLEIKAIGKTNVYVRTKVGFWRISMSTKFGQFFLFHRNKYDSEASFDELTRGGYHRQFDAAPTDSMGKLFVYIKRHDEAKPILTEDWHKLPTKTKLEKKYYRKAKKRARQKSIKNVYDIFAKLEAQDPSLKNHQYN